MFWDVQVWFGESDIICQGNLAIDQQPTVNEKTVNKQHSSDNVQTHSGRTGCKQEDRESFKSGPETAQRPLRDRPRDHCKNCRGRRDRNKKKS